MRGELTLIGPTEERSHTNVIYNFLCSCGYTREMSLMAFRQAVHPTCGRAECKAKRITKARLPPGDASWNRLIERYSSSAIASNLEFSLTREHAIRLFQSPCAYCGRDPSKITRIRGANGQVRWNGIDRYDNLIGYTIENSVSCCEICNLLKGPMDGDRFLSHIRRITVNMNIAAYPTAEEVSFDLVLTADARTLKPQRGKAAKARRAELHVR
jgi:hypothetical protein